jgi:two-component system response regulator
VPRTAPNCSRSLILTSANQDRERIEGHGLRANSYVRKPVDFNRFMEVSRQLGFYWLVPNQPPSVAESK